MQLCSSLNILWHCLSLGLEWKLTFSSPVATAEFSKFSGILSAALSQHHLLGFRNSSSAGISSPPLALFIVMLPKHTWPHTTGCLAPGEWLHHHGYNLFCIVLLCILEGGMATHSSILSWRIPRTEEPSRLQSMELQRVGQTKLTKHHLCILATSSLYLLLLLGPYCFCPLLCPFLHEMFPWYL